jgi:hypothetical protein
MPIDARLINESKRSHKFGTEENAQPGNRDNKEMLHGPEFELLCK